MDLEKTFADLAKKKEKAFMAHVYAGDPSLSFSEKLIKHLEQGGIDIIELGIPFSDPVADGKPARELYHKVLCLLIFLGLQENYEKMVLCCR